MTAEEKKALIRRWCDEFFNKGHHEAIEKFATPDYRLHDPAIREPVGSPQDYRRVLEDFLRGFPDMRLDIEDQVAEGDEVVTRWRMYGRHTGEFAGIAPTNKQVDFNGITISRFSGDKVSEEWEVWDSFGLMKELGVCEAPM